MSFVPHPARLPAPLFALLALLVVPAAGGPVEIAPDGAWTWFNDERAIVHEGRLFAGYVLHDGRYGVTRFDPDSGAASHMVISTGESRQRDDHNNPSITVMPDGRLMVLYARHHADGRFFQRVSRVKSPATDADWGGEVVHEVPERNTYNNTYRLAGEDDRIYNFHRCINFNPTITVSNDLGASWEKPVPFIRVGRGRVRPYPRFCSDGERRIDLIYTDGHPRQVDNSVHHMFYEAGAFHRTDGERIAGFDELPLDHEGGQRGSLVYGYSNDAWSGLDGPDDWIPRGRGWTWDVHRGGDGHPVCVFQVQVDEVTGKGWNHDRIYYYYARWDGTRWRRHFIAQAGRGIYNHEDDYGGGMCLDPEDPGVVYISSNAREPFRLDDIRDVPLGPGERYELYRGMTRDGGESFTWKQLTSGSRSDNLRPIVPVGHGRTGALVWFQGNYRSYTDFDCRVMGLFGAAK